MLFFGNEFIQKGKFDQNIEYNTRKKFLPQKRIYINLYKE